MRGTSSHQENPFVILCEKGAGEDWGECYGMSLVYSGSFLAEAEVDQINQTRFVMGIHPEGFRWRLEKGERFFAPEVIFSFTSDGYGTLSKNFHRFYQEHLIRSKYRNTRRPILLNHWEAMEFHIQEEELVSLAVSAKELGVELFVMDDGWFKGREHDRRGLGDWTPDTKKLPKGVAGLSEKIHGMGMMFGIWIEPEMINEDSDLYRAHPDWILQTPDRHPSQGRSQYVLYELMERFVRAFPEILFEGCSGGGGRFDAGILYYMPQIWCSDNTDAVERISIQYGTSFGYPVSSMGAHVSVSPNLQTGRSMPLETRAIVAMAGAFGYELDVRKTGQEERKRIKEQIQWYKQYQELILYGDYYRLTPVESNREFAAWQVVSRDKKTAVVSAVCLHARSNPLFWRVRLKGLKEDTWYRVRQVRLTDCSGKDREQEQKEGQDENPAKREELLCLGSGLMYGGVNLPVFWRDYESVLYVIEEADKRGGGLPGER